jgi:hypothetical protein
VVAQAQTVTPRPQARAIAPKAARLTAVNAESHFADVRRVVRKVGGHVEEAKGQFVSDPQAKEVRFEVGDRATFAIPYDRITAMHIEEAVESSTLRGRLTKDYLTLHYADTSGQTRFETVRLSKRDVQPALAALETDTGLTIDRTPAKQSFLGIPIRVAIGDRVRVTDQTGRTTKGTITQLSDSALTLDGLTAVPRVFDEASVKKIRLPYSPGPDARLGFGIGVFSGGLAGALVSHGDLGAILYGATKIGAPLGVIATGVIVATGAALHPFDKSKDVYLGGTRGASKTSAIAIGPQIAKERKGVLVSVRF